MSESSVNESEARFISPQDWCKEVTQCEVYRIVICFFLGDFVGLRVQRYETEKAPDFRFLVSRYRASGASPFRFLFFLGSEGRYASGYRSIRK